jgi:hypothetical protein
VREAPILNLSGYTSHKDHNLNLSQCFLPSKMFRVDYLSSVHLWEHKDMYTLSKLGYIYCLTAKFCILDYPFYTASSSSCIVVV